jgi:adenylosuccinate lyase
LDGAKTRKKMIENVLAARYASREMTELFDREKSYLLERELWISILRLQIKNGLKVSPDAISDYEKVKHRINLESIDRREIQLKHDVKARIEEFNSLANQDCIHIGLTSRDITENIDLYLIKAGLLMVRDKSVYVLRLFGDLIEKYKELYFVSRTHNVPAQLITLGKRLSIYAEELINAIERLDYEIDNLKFRGLKGAVGTATDLLALFSAKQIDTIEKELAENFGFKRRLENVGQIYPRSQDFSFVTSLLQICNPIDSFAKTFRLMAGANLVSEGFESYQVGSSAMPHKRNARTAERVNSLLIVMRGLCSMAIELSGNQWNEGDVSCSAARRVMIPDSFFVVDGVLNSIMYLLKNIQVNEEVIKSEIELELPKIASSRILMLSVRNGAGREFAHKKIKELIIRHNENLSAFKQAMQLEIELKIDEKSLESIFADKKSLIGFSILQCESVIKRIGKYPLNKSFNYENLVVR